GLATGQARSDRSLPGVRPGSTVVVLQPPLDALGLYLRVRYRFQGALGATHRDERRICDLSVRRADRAWTLRRVRHPRSAPDSCQRELREEGDLPPGDSSLGDDGLRSLSRSGELRGTFRFRCGGSTAPPLDPDTLALGIFPTDHADHGPFLVPRLDVSLRTRPGPHGRHSRECSHVPVTGVLPGFRPPSGLPAAG